MDCRQWGIEDVEVEMVAVLVVDAVDIVVPVFVAAFGAFPNVVDVDTVAIAWIDRNVVVAAALVECVAFVVMVNVDNVGFDDCGFD